MVSCVGLDSLKVRADGSAPLHVLLVSFAGLCHAPRPPRLKKEPNRVCQKVNNSALCSHFVQIRLGKRGFEVAWVNVTVVGSSM